MRAARRHLALALVAVVASVASFVATQQSVDRGADERTTARADAAATQVLDRVTLASSYVATVRRFMVGQAAVTQRSFASFVNYALGNSGVVDVAWVERVPRRQRAAYERRHGTAILELRAAGLQGALERDQYLVATLIRAAEPNETVPGRDLSIHAELRDVVERPEARYGVTASAQVARYRQQAGVWLVESAPRVTAGEIVSGYVVVFVPQQFLHGSLRGDAADARLQLGGSPPESDRATSSFRAAAQRWHVSVPRAPVSAAAAALPWSIGAGGLAIALLIGALGVGVSGRRNAREDLDRIFTLSRDLIGTANHDYYFTRVNPAFERTLGYRTEELLQRPFLDFVHTDDRAATIAEATRLSGGEETVAFVNRYLCKDGSYRWLEWKAVSVPERDEIYFIARDVTERRAAEEERDRLEAELRQAQKLEALGRMAGGMAHDFNNVLTVVAGYSDLVLAQLGHDDPMRDDVEEIRRATEQARSLTQHLLLFSRSGLPETETTDITDAVRDMDRLLRRLIGSGVELVTVLSPGLGHVPVDRGQLEQIVVNLAINARDAMPNGGRLTIETSRVRVGDADRRLAPGVTPLPPGPYVVLDRSRRRRRHGPGDTRPRGRAVLHDEAGGRRHRTRAVHRLGHGRARRRPHRARQRHRPRFDSDVVPPRAGAGRGAARPRTPDTRPVRRRRSSSSTTRRTYAR
jgi:PAS domain S-box-containing protein